MSTIADVAERAGVSKATASRALSGRGYVAEATRRRVERAAAELSYSAQSSAMSLATGRTRTIGVIVPTLERWYFAEVIAGVQEALLAEDLDLALYAMGEGSRTRERVFERILPRKRFDGLVAVGIQPHARELDRLVALRTPLVCIGPYTEHVDSLAIDDVGVARIATEHLLELGHRDIAFIGGADAAAEQVPLGDRLRVRGYHEAMTAAGLAASARTAHSPSTLSEGYAAAAELLSDRRGRPTAVVCVCDETAIGAIIAARRLGIAVPADLSVIGVDDHRDAEMFALTTIRQTPRRQGADAVALLLDRLEHPDRPVRHREAASALTVRNSTTAPRDD